MSLHVSEESREPKGNRPEPPLEDPLLDPAVDPLQAGREAAARRAWREAFGLLCRAQASGTLGAEDLELLAEAAFWSSDLPACLEAYERSYAAYFETGDLRSAGGVALTLAREYLNKLEPSVSLGWHRLGERLLERVGECAEYGRLVLVRASQALGRGELETAEEQAG